MYFFVLTIASLLMHIDQNSKKCRLGPSAFLWDCSMIAAKLAAGVVVITTLLVVFGGSLHIREGLAAVVPEAVMRFFLTVGGQYPKPVRRSGRQCRRLRRAPHHRKQGC